MKIKLLLLASATLLLTACGGDDNATPVYGKDSGLPVNCRAYIQFAINEYRAGKYTADDTFSAIERNCGANGHSWKDRR